jgi:NitT/TauT family transport system substrate-binding protein
LRKISYFKENGLDVTFKEYDRPSPLIKDILSSHIDFVSATAEFLVVNTSFRGDKLKIIAVVSTQDNQWEVIARKDKNIAQIADLQGKKIGVQFQTVGGFLLGRFLSYYGIDPNTVEIDNLTRPQYMQELSAGDIDAVTIISPFTKDLKHLLGKNAIAWSAQPQRSVYSVSYTNSNFTKKHPEVITRYLTSLIEAEQFVKSQNIQAKNIMQQELQLSTPDIQDLWPKFSFAITLPQELLITMEDEARWMIENKLVSTTKIPNYLDFIYFKGLESVKPETITMIH